MPITQKRIAEKAGVTQKTVSLYFKGSPLVSDQTKEKIGKIAEKYGYWSNSAAVSIKTKKFKRVALLAVQAESTSQLPHPQMMAFMNGAAAELETEGYSLVFAPVRINARTGEILSSNFFSSLSVDAVIGVPGCSIPEKLDKMIDSMGVPAVWLNRDDAPETVHAINFDEEDGARKLAEHLISSGKKKIGWFGPDYLHKEKFHFSSRVRYERIKMELEKSGKRIFMERFPISNISADAALFFAGDEIPDALVCYNFYFAETVFHAAAAKNLSSQTEVLHFASQWEHNPAVSGLKTYYLLPETEVGRKGASILLETLSGGSEINENIIYMKGTLFSGTDREKLKVVAL